MAYETEINRALRSLRNQSIPVSDPKRGDNGFVFDVMGFMLTERQILTLQEENNLNAQGIREFAEKAKPKNKAGSLAAPARQSALIYSFTGSSATSGTAPESMVSIKNWQCPQWNAVTPTELMSTSSS